MDGWSVIGREKADSAGDDLKSRDETKSGFNKKEQKV
jgi:hypothetical protein